MLNFFAGHKTHIVTGLGMLLTVAYALDYIKEEVYFTLGGLLGMSGLSTLRRAITTTEQAVTTQVAEVKRAVAVADAKVGATAAEVREVKAVMQDALPSGPSSSIRP